MSPIGIGAGSFCDALSRGTSGITRITAFDPSSLPSQIAGEVRGFDPLTYLPRRDVVRTDLFIQYALAAADQAIADAQLKIDDPGDRIGVSIGTGMGGIPWVVAASDALRKAGPNAVSPYALPGALPHMAAAWVSMRTGARGPLAAPATACAAGSCAIGEALRAIRSGEADAMLAGGTEALIHPLVVAGFCALRALSTHNGEPTHASRPFDRDRDGFVLGAGAGILVLEELELARRRGARIHAELVGFGLTADAHHPTAPSSDGPARAMKRALADARLQPDEIEYINAHGTATRHNDATETAAIKEAFGAHARSLLVSSTKSMTGHLLGAAGAVEAIATTLALGRGFAPPTINYRTCDPACDLDYVPNHARPVSLRYAMSNSFAFGGANAVLVFKRWVHGDEG